MLQDPEAEVDVQEQEQHLSQQKQSMEEATLPLMLDAMWAANVVDIETTVRSVCQKARPGPRQRASAAIMAHCPKRDWQSSAIFFNS